MKVAQELEDKAERCNRRIQPGSKRRQRAPRGSEEGGPQRRTSTPKFGEKGISSVDRRKYQRAHHLAVNARWCLMPAFSGGEPYERMIRRSRDRKALHDRLVVEIRELSRSSPYTDIDDRSRELTAVLSESASDEKARLDAVILRLTNISTMIPLDSDVLRVSIDYQGRFALRP